MPNLAERETELKKAARRGRIMKHTGPTAIVRAANRQRQPEDEGFRFCSLVSSRQTSTSLSNAARFVPRLDGSSSLCLAVCKKTNPVDHHATPLDLLKRTTGSPGRSPPRSTKVEPCGGHLSNP